MITTAAKNFDRYAQDLNSITEVANVIRNGEVLRSGFSAVRLLADNNNVSYEVRDVKSRRLGPMLRGAFVELRALAIAHRSREVRQALQQQAYVFIALKDALQVGYYPTRVRQTGVFAFPIAFAVSLALVAAGMVVARQLIELFWQVPPVEYLPLTLAVVGCGATLLYSFVSTDKYAESEAKDLQGWRVGVSRASQAIRATLWPGKLAKPLQGRAEVATRSLRSRLLQVAIAVLAGWPMLFVAFDLACFTGALLFDLAGWAPTAGFNLAALLSSIGLSILYGLASDQ